MNLSLHSLLCTRPDTSQFSNLTKTPYSSIRITEALYLLPITNSSNLVFLCASSIIIEPRISISASTFVTPLTHFPSRILFTCPTTRRPIGNEAAGSGRKPSHNSFSMVLPSTWRPSRKKQPFLLVSTTKACTLSPTSGIPSSSMSPSNRLGRRLTSTTGFDETLASTRHCTKVPCGN